MGVGLIVGVEVMRAIGAQGEAQTDSESELIGEGESSWPSKTPT